MFSRVSHMCPEGQEWHILLDSIFNAIHPCTKSNVSCREFIAIEICASDFIATCKWGWRQDMRWICFNRSRRSRDSGNNLVKWLSSVKSSCSRCVDILDNLGGIVRLNTIGIIANSCSFDSGPFSTSSPEVPVYHSLKGPSRSRGWDWIGSPCDWLTALSVYKEESVLSTVRIGHSYCPLFKGLGLSDVKLLDLSIGMVVLGTVGFFILKTHSEVIWSSIL